MRFKKIMASLLAASLALSQMTTGIVLQTASVQSFAAESSASQSIGNSYFYEQLPSDASVFYDAINEMYKSGILKTGNGDLELVAGGYLTKEQAASYANGGAGVLELFGAARDAFYMDHTDIFYVDISSLSIRVTSSEDGGYRVYIGTGRRDSYYAQGYTSAEQVDGLLAEYEEAVSRIAADAEALTIEEGKDPVAEKIRYVHDYLTHHTSYRLENVCKPENIGFIRTSYGALVAGEAVCEGYSRAFKAVMDRLGIPCVLVNGVYKHSEDQLELHMWTEVEIDDQWYGVDVTMDDPKAPATTKSAADESNGIDGYETDEYLLVGSLEMDVHHAMSGIISDAKYEFGYPTLKVSNYGVKTVYDDGDLTVRYSQNGELDGERVDMFYLSYKGMGVMKAREQGFYLLCNDENTGWYYIAPEYYPALVDTDTELQLPLPSQIDDVQFAVTDIPYQMTTLGEYEIIDQTFYGTEDDFLEASGVYYNSEGGYEPPPYPKTVTPSMTTKLSVNAGTFHVSITYNDILVPVEGEEQGVVMTSTGRTALEYARTENFAWDGESTVTFDFTPSRMFADDNVLYYLTLSGLVGEKSGKAPYQVTYAVANDSGLCCYRCTGFNWNLFGQPSLIDNTDMSMDGWKTADGTPIGELEALKHRMALVATKTSDEQAEVMNDMIAKENSTSVLKSETYNISLTVCQKMIVETGQAVRVSVGFPDGYGPEDEGVTFKAYHFIKNAAGEVTGVEEIPCVVTQYGLIISCYSFSPYAIVAVKDDGTQSDAGKSVVAVGTVGGMVSGAEGIAVLKEGESAVFGIQADEGYVIESVSVGGVYAEITDSDAMELTIGYDDIDGSSCIVDVKFASKTVIEKEAERGETAVQIDAEAEAAQPSEELPEETTTEPAETTTTAAPMTTTATETSANTTTTTETSADTTTETSANTTTETSVITTTAPETTASTTASSETTAASDHYFASIDELRDMAIKDYQQKNGTTPAGAEAVVNDDGTVSIVLTDEEGNVLDTYVIDPVTATGIDSSGGEVNLPQTGNNALHTAVAASAALMLTLTGAFAVLRSGVIGRRKEEESSGI